MITKTGWHAETNSSDVIIIVSEGFFYAGELTSLEEAWTCCDFGVFLIELKVDELKSDHSIKYLHVRRVLDESVYGEMVYELAAAFRWTVHVCVFELLLVYTGDYVAAEAILAVDMRAVKEFDTFIFAV